MRPPAECDVLVAGSGAGGLAAAVTAARLGLHVVVAEKESHFGGTTAFSGGWLWVPNHPLQKSIGVTDSMEAAATYLLHEAGENFDAERVDAFLRHAPQMVEFFMRETAVRFDASATFSDYHPDAPGGLPGGRSIVAQAFDGRQLGPHLAKLRPPLPQLTVFGIMIGSGVELMHFMRWSKSLRSAAFVARRLLGHGTARAFHGRGVRLTNGNALAGRLLKSALDAGVTLLSDAAVSDLSLSAGRAVAAKVNGQDVRARKGIVLACGGFPRDAERTARLFPHREHYSPAPPGNTGDGLRLAEAAGALIDESLPNAAAWVPVSQVPGLGVFPHFIDRAKPGVIAVTRHGRRFVNEGNSYHDFVQALLRAGETSAWLITDHRALRAYGLGFVKPRPMPLAPHLKSGYLLNGDSPEELAAKADIDVRGFAAALRKYNEAAKSGSDPDFRKGENAYNRFYGDPDIRPNPCVAPIVEAPFYAVKVVIGDLGTYAGIATNGNAQVLDRDRKPIPGLYAAGNDALSIMGGAYPGPGITLGPAMTFGWLAARHMAANN